MSIESEGLILRGDMQIDTAVSALHAAGADTKDILLVLSSREFLFDDQDQERGAIIPHEERPPVSFQIGGEDGARLKASVVMGLELTAADKDSPRSVAATALLAIMSEE